MPPDHLAVEGVEATCGISQGPTMPYDVHDPPRIAVGREAGGGPPASRRRALLDQLSHEVDEAMATETCSSEQPASRASITPRRRRAARSSPCGSLLAV
jgi:hypothetical protein